MPALSWRCQILLLLIYNIYWLLVPARCITFNGRGSLTVEPPVPFLMGSNLTLYCQIDNCTHAPHIYLQIQKEKVLPLKLVKCTATFKLTNVREPKSSVFCMKQDPGTDDIVTGIDLYSGIPPDQAQSISCETTRNAHFIDCKWNKGRKTYVSTTYNVLIKKENGSLVHSQQLQNKDNCSIPRELFDEDMKFQLSITAHNDFGLSRSEPLNFSLSDVVIPETPHITQIDFRNTSLTAFLQWETSESSENLKPYIRRRATNGHWEEVSELSDDLVKVAGLRPLTDYEFQVKTCIVPVQQTDANLHSVRRIVCSKWSSSFWKKTPGKGPSQPVSVWRDSVMTMRNEQQMVTVFWKPPPADDFSGVIHRYEIFFGDGQKQEEVCATLSPCSATVPLLRPISVTAVTTYGTSPPAAVPLTQSDAPGPVWRVVNRALNGSSVTVSWAHPEQNDELMNYVTEWTKLPPSALDWQTVPRHHNTATITGLEEGVLYHISLYAVTTRGISTPSSSRIYSKELKPKCGPDMSVLVHESKRVKVQWNELREEQRGGFITSYTIYYKVLDSSSPQLSVSVPVSSPREQWLDCPEGTLALQMSASTAAGEGPMSNLISSHPPAPSVGFVIVIVFIITFFIAIIVNLMCWKCVRKRIKQKCIAWGPEWLGDSLPEPKNSNAFKLLQSDRSEPTLISSYIDPPLSPISFLPRDEREELYPCVHVELGPQETNTTSPAPESTADGFSFNNTMHHGNYKPQTNAFTFPEKADGTDIEEEKSSTVLFEGFTEGLLSNLQVDLSDSQTGPGLDTVNCNWWSKTTEINIAMMEIKTSTDKMSTKSNLSLIDSEVSADELLVDFSDNDEGTLAGGYFPQLFSQICST